MAANAKPQETFRDGISIVSITPDSLKSGEQATVTVRVRYELFSCNEAEINLGFNEGRGNGYRIDAKKVVGIGSGEATLSASLTAKKIGTMPLMKVFVNLSEYPHRSTWSPLCDDNGEIATE